MTRRIKLDIPGVDWRVSLEDAAQRGPAALFAEAGGDALPLVVELGFGRGEFLLDLASHDPESAFLGVELSFKRTIKLARRLARTPLCNVRLIQGRAEQVVVDVLRDASVSCFWINFPDPWPKARHAKRRLLQPELAAWLARRLAPGGALRVATDDADYAEWIDTVLRGVPTLENRHAPASYLRHEEGRQPTAYELEWRAQGRALHFFHYARRAKAGSPSASE